MICVMIRLMDVTFSIPTKNPSLIRKEKPKKTKQNQGQQP